MKNTDIYTNAAPIDIDPKKFPNYIICGIKVLAKDRVVAVSIGTVKDKHNVNDIETYKQVCREPDIFDLRYAVALALTKYIHRKPGDRLTTAGLEYYTTFYLTNMYDFNKEVDRALKEYARSERRETLEKAKAEEIKAIKARRAAKQKRNRQRRKERRIHG